MMVAVYDFANSLNGFIDPNSPAFTPQNTDRAYYIDSAGYSPNPADAGVGRDDQAPPVYTKGDVIAAGNLTIGGDAEIDGDVSVGTNLQITGTTTMNGPAVYDDNSLTQNGATSLTFDCSRGNFFSVTINSSTNFSIDATNVPTKGQNIYVVYNNTGAYNPSITMGSNIREYYSGGGGVALPILANVSATQSFITHNGKLLELSRMNVNSA